MVCSLRRIVWHSCETVSNNMQNSEKYKLDRKDPFREEPLHKAFYHPTTKIHIETESASMKNGEDFETKLSPSSKRFLKAGNMFTSKSPPTGWSPGDNSSKFDESWPTSDRPSTVDIPEYISPGSGTSKLDMDKGSLALLLKDKPWLAALIKSDPVKSKLDFEMQPERDGDSVDKQKKTTKESTLSKYIDRFRHGTPMSRDERQQKKTTDPRDFWWLQSPPRGGAGTPTDSSTPIDESEKQAKLSKSSKMNRPKRVRESYDEDTQLLQNKADLLLETASSLNSSDPIVSTVGLSSETDSSRHSSSFSEKPFRPEFIKRQIDKDPLVMKRTKKPVNPEEDILAQWRMMRRRELAQAGLKPPTTGPAATVRPEPRTQAAGTHAPTGVDSKLEEFRSHLTRATHGMFEQPISGRLTTEELDVETKQTKITQATELTKEDKVVETACQTSPPDSTGSSPTDTAASLVQQTSTVGPPGGGKHVIASPALKYKLRANKARDTVEPHYHLSCDVIPWQPSDDAVCGCCHGHHHRYKCDHCYHDNQKDTTHDKGKRIHKEGKTKRKLEEVNDFESDYEIYKQKHMQRLERELRSERDSKLPDRDFRGHCEGHKGKKYEQPERDKPKGQRGQQNDVESEETDGESGVTLSMEDLKLIRKKVHTGKKENSEGKSDEGVRESSSSNFSGDRESSDGRRRSKGMREEKIKTVHDAKKIEKASKAKEDRERTVVPPRSRSPTKLRRNGQKEMVKPGRSISPEKRDQVNASRGSRVGLGSTIGQVVTDRLFAGSPLSVRASVESETSLRFPPSPTADNEALLCSDEEEFIDDEILKDLRAKRSVYVRRLQAIEALLQERTSPTTDS